MAPTNIASSDNAQALGLVSQKKKKKKSSGNIWPPQNGKIGFDSVAISSNFPRFFRNFTHSDNNRAHKTEEQDLNPVQ